MTVDRRGDAVVAAPRRGDENRSVVRGEQVDPDVAAPHTHKGDEDIRSGRCGPLPGVLPPFVGAMRTGDFQDRRYISMLRPLAGPMITKRLRDCASTSGSCCPCRADNHHERGLAGNQFTQLLPLVGAIYDQIAQSVRST